MMQEHFSSPTLLRLSLLRKHMKTQNIDALLIRSTDQYLNEYVPADQSRRTYITGFTGSVGDALVTDSEQILFVDGRYALQSRQECPDWDVRVASLGMSLEASWLKELPLLKERGAKSLGLEMDRIPITLFEKVRTCADLQGLRLIAPATALVDLTRKEIGPNPATPSSKIWSIPLKISGNTTEQRLKTVANFLSSNNIDALYMVLLDEIAWLVNMRGNEFPYQATFASKAIAFADEVWILLSDAHRAMLNPNPGVRFIAHDKWAATLKKHFAKKTYRIGIDPDKTPESAHQELKTAGARIVFTQSPFGPMKGKKTIEELAHMRSAFARADHVVYKTQNWVLKQMLMRKFEKNF
jgi:Xaa-Pro aminopeptidase